MYQIACPAELVESVLDGFTYRNGELVLCALGAAHSSLTGLEQMRLKLLWNSSLLHSSIFTLF
jgi:hypothetical protein